jgi:hypothetical protein
MCVEMSGTISEILSQRDHGWVAERKREMSTAWMIYFWTRLDPINCALGGITLFLIICMIISAIVWMVNASSGYSDAVETAEKAKSVLLKLSIAAGAITFISIWIPSQKDVALIVGGQLATEVVQSKESKELGGKVLKFLDTELDKRIKSNQASSPQPSMTEQTNESP